jgi:cytochrome c1
MLISIPDTAAWVRDVFASNPEVKSAEVDAFIQDRVLLMMQDGTGKVLDIQGTDGRSFIHVPAPDAEEEASEASAESDDLYDETDMNLAKEKAVKTVLKMCEEARRARRPLPTLEEVMKIIDP